MSDQPYAGEDRRAPDESRWHLDKKVPLSLIAAMIAQVVIVTMFFADIKKDVELLKAKTTNIESRYESDKSTLRETLQIMREEFRNMDGKLDRLIERSKP